MLREWERVRLPRSSFGAAEYAALGDLPGHAFRLRERGGQLELCARALVGRVQVGSLSITVLPKLADRSLLRLFNYAYDLDDLDFAEPTTYPGGALLQDVLAELLRRHVQRIVDRGLHRSYQRTSLELTAPRGRIDMSALARRLPLMRPVLPCVTHDRSVDHTLNQLLRAGLVVAARLVEHEPLRARLRDLSQCLGDEITAVPLTRTLIAAARRGMHRLVHHYRPALQIVELLYAGAGLDLVASSARFTAAGFLFDMNRFFQALVLKLLRDGLDDCEVAHEQSLRGAYRWAHPCLPGRRRPRPRPDITVLRRGQRFILDAKYRDLSIGPLPREILYQLTMYAASQGPGGAAAMIYPRHEAAALSEERLDLFEPLHTSPHASLYLRPVPLLELAASLDAGEQGVTFRRRLARTLAFGTAGPVVAHALVTSA